MVIYKIHEGNMDKLTKKLTRIGNKCSRLGVSFTFRETGEEEFQEEEITRENGEKEKIVNRFVFVEVEGRAVVPGFEFVAGVDYTENGNVINKINDSFEVPARYYTGALVCEHCGTKHNRVRAYIVRNTETGEYKEVGAACLAEYTFGLSAEVVAAWMDGIKELEKGEAPLTTESVFHYVNTFDFLRCAAETIRIYGYVKRCPGIESTASRASDFYGVTHGWYINQVVRDHIIAEMKKVGFNFERPENAEKVRAAVTWLKEQDCSNNYMHNLLVAAGGDYTRVEHTGILVSLFPTYDRELEYQAEKRRREAEKAAEIARGLNSVWVGNLKDRIEVVPAEVKVLTSFENCWDGYHTTITYLWKIVGQDGNIYTWKTSNSFNEDKDGNWILPPVIKGTIKAHNEYRGVKQTELTRCKF